jgi:ribosomal protein S4
MNFLKFKHCRRLGENIWNSKKLTPKQQTTIRLVVKKNTSQRKSDFSKKLQQMKKLAYFYGIRSLNKHMRRGANKVCDGGAKDKKKSIILHFENRLDVILVRILFCSTLFSARQFIRHNKVLINCNRVNIPGAKLRNGDFLSIAPDHYRAVKNQIRKSLGTSLRNPLLVNELSVDPRGHESRSKTFKDDAALGLRTRPAHHLEVNYKTMSAVLLYEPTQIQFPYQVDLDLLF